MQALAPIMFTGILFAGCSTLPKPAQEKLTDEPYQGSGRIQYLSHGLSDRAEVVKHECDRTESGLLRLRTVLHNDKGHDVVVEIKVTFTDEDGFAREETNWEPVILGKHDHVTFTKVSLGTQVCDYRLALRDPKKFDPRG